MSFSYLHIYFNKFKNFRQVSNWIPCLLSPQIMLLQVSNHSRKLIRRSNYGKRPTRIELVSQPWQGRIITIIRKPQNWVVPVFVPITKVVAIGNTDCSFLLRNIKEKSLILLSANWQFQRKDLLNHLLWPYPRITENRFLFSRRVATTPKSAISTIRFSFCSIHPKYLL